MIAYEYSSCPSKSGGIWKSLAGQELGAGNWKIENGEWKGEGERLK